MNKAKLFQNGQSQAVRLPKEYRFEGDEVYVNKIDDAVVLFKKKDAWNLFEKSLYKFGEDFLEDRNQPLENDKRKKI